MNTTNEDNAQSAVENKYGFQQTYEYLRAFFQDVLDLQKGVNKLGTIEEIRDKKSMAGANAWMLMCSIVIASIGLSQNSQAVIIGGMLISPLMSPILGIGLSVGINDMDTLRKSLAHFGVAMAIAIVTSTVYFSLIDFGEITPEIQARTNPTFLDILVAVFGGLAGIISIARKDISTTLPGVAIATALMPPLCVTGYGLANVNAEIAIKSFYLFFLNTFFVALATYVIVRFLKFPYKKYVRQAEKRRNRNYIILCSALMVIPSIIIFRGVLTDLRQQAKLNQFKETCLGENEVYLDNYELIEGPETKTLYLKCYGNAINNQYKSTYESCLDSLGLSDVNIEIMNSSDVNLEHLRGLENKFKDISKQLSAVNEEKKQQQTLKIREKYQADSSVFAGLNRDARTFLPEIVTMSFAKMYTASSDSAVYRMPTLIVDWELQDSKEKNTKQKQLQKYMQQKLELDTLKIISY